MTTPPVTTRLVQKIAEGKTFYELSWKVKVMIKKKEKSPQVSVLRVRPNGAF